jgi:Transglutaminase-like superfamily
MRRLRRFLALTRSEQRLLIEATLMLGVIRVGLKLLRFPTLWRLLNRTPRPPIGLPASGRLSLDRVAWAVTTASPYVLGSRRCLPQALAAQQLLVRRGLPARLRLGVARDDGGRVLAHAWMETDGRVVIGGSTSELERFTPLLALDADSR